MNFQTICICIIIFQRTTDAVISTNVSFHGYRKWTPFNSTRNDMYCPEDCFDNPDEDESCCCCSAVTCWELDAAACNITVGQLYVEYKDIYGSAVFIPSGNYTLYEVVHRNGRLTTFPENLCEFADSLVKLDLSYNRLGNISDIRCLNKLDTLRLDGNKIKEISNDTFSNMEYIRILSLSRNNIQTLHPNTNKKKNGNILMTDFSYNVVESLDVTNVLQPGPFCNMSCEGCEVTEQTNILNYVMNENNIHGPGRIILSNTTGESFLNLTQFGVHDYTKLGYYFKGRLDHDGSSISCDCSLYPFFTGLGKDAAKYWPRLDYGDIICNDPENMKGTNITHLYHTQRFEELVCNLPDCPSNCTCTDKPSERNVHVVCKGQTSMPEFVPVGYWNNDRINLDLSDPSNDISEFSNKEYIDRLVKVNLTGNNIQKLDTEAAERLNGDLPISMSEQQLKELPRAFHKLNPGRITFGANPVRCDCDNVWIGDWIRLNEAQGKLQCFTSKGVVPAEDVNADYLECNEQQPIPIYVPVLLAFLTVSVFLIGVATYYFRYEIMLLKRKYLRRTGTPDICEFDAMLTFSEENPDIFRWLEHRIIPALKIEGYSLFVPFYDISFGGNREYELAEGVNKSKNYVVFLCDKYLCDDNTVQEFEIVWKHFRMDATKNIIVINFDTLQSSEIFEPRLRAFRRIQEDLNFAEREVKFFERLKQRLGYPVKNKTEDVNKTDQHIQDIKSMDVEAEEQETQGDDSEADICDAKRNCDDDAGDRGARGIEPGLMKNSRWYDRLAVKNTTCNCTYRKCYLHAGDAFRAHDENDWLRKRAQSAKRRQLRHQHFKKSHETVHTVSVKSVRPKSSMSQIDQNDIDYDFEDNQNVSSNDNDA